MVRGLRTGVRITIVVGALVSSTDICHIPPAERDARIAALQAKLVPLWRTIKTMTQDPQTIVVVPSLTLDGAPHGAAQRHGHQNDGGPAGAARAGRTELPPMTPAL